MDCFNELDCLQKVNRALARIAEKDQRDENTIDYIQIFSIIISLFTLLFVILQWIDIRNLGRLQHRRSLLHHTQDNSI